MEPNNELKRIAREFKVAGLPTPGSVRRKSFLFQDTVSRTVILTDVTRCSTTLLTAFALGAKAVYVAPKNSPHGVNLPDIAAVQKKVFPGEPYVVAGELHGKPMPGAVFGNSPRAVRERDVRDKVVYYHSTNFGLAFQEMISVIDLYGPNEKDKILMGSLANVKAVFSTIAEMLPERLIIIGGGFYDNSSIEDLVFGGRIISNLGIDPSQMDDDALVMYLVSGQLTKNRKLLEAMHQNWIGRALQFYDMEADIASVIDGTGLIPGLFQKMQCIVPVLKSFEGVPFWIPQRTDPGPASLHPIDGEIVVFGW